MINSLSGNTFTWSVKRIYLGNENGMGYRYSSSRG